MGRRFFWHVSLDARMVFCVSSRHGTWRRDRPEDLKGTRCFRTELGCVQRRRQSDRPLERALVFSPHDMIVSHSVV